MQPVLTQSSVNNSIEEGKKQTSSEDKSAVGNNLLPTIEEIVEQIMKNDYQGEQFKIANQTSQKNDFSEINAKEWEEQKHLYLKFEKMVRENYHRIPSWPVAGPLNYAMSLEQMKDVITKKFKEMVLSGNLITEEQLTKNHNREFFYPTDARGSNNLTRIWGAEFLRLNLLKDEKLNAPEHFLVVDETASEIDVQVWHGQYPYLSVVENAHVLSQKIEGLESDLESEILNKLYKLGYGDFSDRRNIICDSTGANWVVDTEVKSFDIPEWLHIHDYLKKRFKVLAGSEYNPCYQVFKIAISDIHLK